MGLVYTAFFITLVPAVLAAFKWRLMQEHQRWFSVLLWFIVVNSFAGWIWTLQTGRSNTPFFYVYILVEYLILLQVYRFMFSESIKKQIWVILAIGFSVIWLIDVFTGKGWWGFPDYIHALEAVILLVIVAKWFLKMLKEKTVLHPEKTFEFWLSAGLLLFFSGNFLLFAFPKLMLTAGKEVFEAIWKVNAILNILLYTIYTVALLWVKRTTK
ncbi:hypothetical protein POV27_00185 [Aureisphaera galaxeae]|uniref:hypothetical protein n=1 Tax=Aureisphaera galaxeae TaxID=1538023 RepID=UPI00234FE460|nr:hypothetical protein [Aureisphaera galaxeae]MDC8002453.1 hypothetical protein [Aureisphaera galaxeae]